MSKESVKSDSDKDRHSTFSSFDLIKISLVGFFGSLLLRLIRLTQRWQRVDLSDGTERWANGPARILAFWHGQQLLMPWIYLSACSGKGDKSMHALISQHRDGRFIASVLRFLGISGVAGSSTRGGREALFELIQLLQKGKHVSITPDGPKGPNHEAKPGILRIAQRSGVPIYPAAIACSNAWYFKSWDKMFLPKPFSRTVLVIGKPLVVPKKTTSAEFVALTKQLQEALDQLNSHAVDLLTSTVVEGPNGVDINHSAK